MIITRQLGNYKWIDVESPTKEDVDTLVQAHGVDQAVARDLLAPTPKQFIEDNELSNYIVMRIPVFNRSDKNNMEQEVDFVISEKNLITVRYDSIESLYYFAKRFETDQILQKEHEEHPFFGLMVEIYKFLFDELSFMESKLRQIENSIFNGEEKDMVFVLSNASRNMLVFRRTLLEHKYIWTGLADTNKNYGHNFDKNLNDIAEQWQRLMSEADNLSAIVSELRETNNSLLSTKQNEIMKVFTILAFVTFPLSLIASIFGMNTKYIPIVGVTHDFWLVLSIMLFATFAMFGFFRYKKWL